MLGLFGVCLGLVLICSFVFCIVLLFVGFCCFGWLLLGGWLVLSWGMLFGLLNEFGVLFVWFGVVVLVGFVLLFLRLVGVLGLLLVGLRVVYFI